MIDARRRSDRCESATSCSRSATRRHRRRRHAWASSAPPGARSWAWRLLRGFHPDRRRDQSRQFRRRAGQRARRTGRHQHGGLSHVGRRRRSGVEGIGFAIPVATAKAVLEQIIKNGKVIRGWIGADYTDRSAAAGRRRSASAACSFCGVIPESPAAQAGLQPSDVLQSLTAARSSIKSICSTAKPRSHPARKCISKDCAATRRSARI